MRHEYTQCKAIELKCTWHVTGTTSPIYLAVPYNLAEDPASTNLGGEAMLSKACPKTIRIVSITGAAIRALRANLFRRKRCVSCLYVRDGALLFHGWWKEARSVCVSFISCERKTSICNSRYQNYFKVVSSSQLGPAIHKYTEVLLASVAAARENLYMLQQPITPRRRGIVLQYVPAR